MLGLGGPLKAAWSKRNPLLLTGLESQLCLEKEVARRSPSE